MLQGCCSWIRTLALWFAVVNGRTENTNFSDGFADARDRVWDRWRRPEWARTPSGTLEVSVFAVNTETGEPVRIARPVDAVRWEQEHGRPWPTGEVLVQAATVLEDGPLEGWRAVLEARFPEGDGEPPTVQVQVSSPPMAWDARTTARAMQRLSAQRLYQDLPTVLAQRALTVPLARRVRGDKPGNRPGRRGNDEVWLLKLAELRVAAEAAAPRRQLEWMHEQLAAEGENRSIATLKSAVHDLRHKHGLLTARNEPVALTPKALEIRRRSETPIGQEV